jgi:hypothetical protein
LLIRTREVNVMMRFGWAALPSALLAMTGCGGEGETKEPLAAATQHASVECTSADESSGFVTRELDRQAGVFSLSFAATPGVAPSDALVGVTLRAADHYGDLAAIVRFNPDGFIDARNGSEYAAASSIPYAAGVTRQFHMSVDLLRRTYSVSVDNQELARDFAFRTEQANALVLDGLALKVDSGTGLDVCNLHLTTVLACDSAAPGEGFHNLSLPASSAAFTLSFLGFPRAPNLDGVMGISAGPASSFSDLAVALRFGPSGTVDVRDGASYSVLDPTGYTANDFYRVTLVADVTDRTFSVVTPLYGEVTRELAFRPEQANVASLGNFAAISDSSAGVLTVCDVRGGGAQGAAWLHDVERYGRAPYSLAVSNDRPVLASSSRTLVLDAQGNITQEAPHGGDTVSDGDGNIYLVGTWEDTWDGGPPPVPRPPGGGYAYISKYDADFEHVYTRWLGTTEDTRIMSPSADDEGRIAFVTRDPYTSVTSAVMLHPDGETRWSTDYPVGAVALDTNGEALIATNTPTASSISKLDVWANPIWSATFPTEGAAIHGVIFDSLGNAVFWGAINGTIDFGGTPFTARSPESSLGLLGSLAPDGTPRFVGTTAEVESIKRAIADGAGNVIVVGTGWNPDVWGLNRYDSDGTLTASVTADELLPELFLGGSGDVSVDSTGAVYWQVFPRNGSGAALSYLVKLLPPND